MIVKNEMAVLKKCLDSISDYLDYWVICDTGSTDGTQEFIKNYFKEKGIPGTLHEDKWVNFGHNRSLYFKYAQGKSDYLIVLDADEIVLVNDDNFKSNLSDDKNIGYYIGYEGILDYSYNILLSGNILWKSVGVTHEYVTSDEPHKLLKFKDLKIDHIGNGANKENKYTRDIELLTQGIKDEPNNSRYYFYLANSYYDIKEYDKALKYYLKRTEMKGWEEEVYFSIYKAGLCQLNMNKHFETEVLPLFLKAFNYRKSRLEALYEIVNYYRTNEMWKEGYAYGLLGYETAYPEDILFINKSIHTHQFLDELAVCATNSNHHDFAIELYNKLLKLDFLKNDKRIKSNLQYSLNAKKKINFKNISAKDLFRANRFDLPIKHLYARYRENNIQSSFGLNAYKEHLRLWSGFIEYDKPEKNTFEAFKKVFDDLLDSIKENGFNKNISKIPINFENKLLNGSHRTTACALYNKKISYYYGKDLIDGWKNCDYSLFERLGLNKDYMDAAALEMTRINPNLFVVSLFPAAVGNDAEVEKLLNKFGSIAYKKEVKLNETGAYNYMRHAYKGEPWIGNLDNNFKGAIEYAKNCFSNSNPMRVYLVEFDSVDIVKRTKLLIRNIYKNKIFNTSVHITDTHTEALTLARALFNENSIHFLNNSKLEKYNSFFNQLSYFKNYINENNLDVEDYCITASSVLSIYGLKEGRDLDYLHKGKQIKGHKMIHSHNEYGIGKYHTHIDNIIYNPLNHFYFDNVKFSSLNTVKLLKIKRNEEKDIIDIKLIDSVVNG